MPGLRPRARKTNLEVNGTALARLLSRRIGEISHIHREIPELFPVFPTSHRRSEALRITR